MTALSIIQNAAIDPGIGLRQPSAVFGSSDLTTLQLLQLAQRSGRQLAKRHDWQALTVERTFTSLNQVEQTGAIPSDYDRLIYAADVWDRTQNLKFAGPTPSRVWQDLQTNLTGGIVGWWRLLGGELHIFPAQDAGNTLAFEYISKNWCESSGGTGQDAFAANTDVARIPEHLIELEIIWRWRKAKELDYAEELATAEREIEKACARDRGTGVIYPPPSESTLPPVPTWPGTITVP